MKRKPKDTYRILSARNLSSSDVDVLFNLYQPLIGGDAILVYMTLASSANDTRTYNHARLFTLMNSIDSEVFERACTKLEEYMLLRTYIKEMDNKNTFIYQLLSPLCAKDFLLNGIYVKKLMSIAGKRTYDESLVKYATQLSETDGFKEITIPMKNVKEEDYDNSTVFTSVRPRLTFSQEDETINFDYDRFLKITSTLVFPAELRTQENMALIGKLATVYGLNADTMLKLLVARNKNGEYLVVKNSLNPMNCSFDADKLRFLCETSKPDITKAKDVYTLPPVSFLQGKQNGATVSLSDKKLLERLSVDMHFSNEVINVMIEYILKISGNRLHHNFVEMVAGEWARDGVTTKELAILETKKQIKNISNKNSYRVSTPVYTQNKQVEEKYANMTNEDILAQFKKMQKNMGDK